MTHKNFMKLKTSASVNKILLEQPCSFAYVGSMDAIITTMVELTN